ncbi:MAG: peptide chain release factor-like protein [Deltaproteobacteria bacterium]|nr:peptide chain release factor-like protein [Deltaproteobacteria bacterium]MBW1872623.1 peptide chain release factor-like protein [Deltaproteobacteria bacterium]
MTEAPTENEVKYSIDRTSLERDSIVEFFTGSGPGGQHRNRSRTAVRIKHEPSGIVVTATERRSQAQNLEAAFDRLIKRLTQLNIKPKKRRPTRPSRASRERRLTQKTKRAQTKRFRRRPSKDD